MSEFKEAEGNLEAFQIAQKDGKPIEGTKKDGTPWQMYKYVIGGITYSGFKKLEEFEVGIGEYVLVTYTEKPNPSNPNTPYKNIVNIVKGVSQKEIKESNEQYNVKPVEQAPLPKDTIQTSIQVGMIFNNTVRWIINERNLKGEGTTYTLDENFDKVFEHLWKLAEGKRKEKLQ